MIIIDIHEIEAMAAKYKVNMSQLCELADVDRSTVTRIKNGSRKNPRTDTMKKLNDTLNLIKKRKVNRYSGKI